MLFSLYLNTPQNITKVEQVCWNEKFISSLKHVVRKLELSLTEMQGDTKNTVQKWKYVLHLSMQTAYLRKQRTNLIVLKKRDLGFCFLSCKTKFQLTVNVQLAWRSPVREWFIWKDKVSKRPYLSQFFGYRRLGAFQRGRDRRTPQFQEDFCLPVFQREPNLDGSKQDSKRIDQ